MATLIGICGLALAGLAAWWVRRRFAPGPPAEAALNRDFGLTAYELAYLVEGSGRAAAAVASLIFRDIVWMDPESRRLRVARELPGMAPQLERDVVRAIGGESVDVKEVRPTLEAAGERLRPRLEALGLVADENLRLRASALGLLACLATLFGFAVIA